MFELFFLRHSV